MDMSALFSAASIEIAGTLATGLFLLKVAASAMVRTNQYESKIIAGFGGQFKRSTSAGLSGKKPWPLETVAKTVSLRDQILDLVIDVRTTEKSTVKGAVQAATADQTATPAAPDQINAQLHYFVKVPVQIKLAVEDPIKAERLIGSDLSQPSPRRDFIDNRVRNTVTAHFSDKSLQEVYNERSMVAEEVRRDLETQITEKYGLRVSTVTVDNPNLDERLSNAIRSASEAGLLLAAQRQSAEADRIKRVANAQATQAEMEAQANGERAILVAKAEGQGQIRIKEAEAEKQSRILLGQGVAAEQTAIFDSLADAMKKMSEHEITSQEVMKYMQDTNDRTLRRQIAEAFATAYGNIPNAMLFAGTPNSAQGEGDGSGLPAGMEKMVEMVVTAVTAAAMRPELATRKVTAPASPAPAK